MLNEENNADSDNEPQISSDNPVDRKAARELRIQRRHDTIKRDEAAAEFKETFDDEEVLNPVEQQTVDSAALVQHLLADGEERISNVRVASDAREVARRFTEFKKKGILGKLEAEALLAEKKFDEIAANWNPILELNDPLDIQHEMNVQKERCKALMMQKDAIIQGLKEELKQADETFYKDLQKQLNDIKQLGERIDAQVLLMKNAYQSQLTMIENSIELERVISIENNKKRWNVLYKQRDKEEVSNIEKKFTQQKKFETTMDELTIHHREKYRAAKIQLENEIQTLQKELQQLKATCLINSEKIDYNYQVLKRREEENVFVRSQQKRRLNKMQDIINKLRNKIKDAQKERAVEETKSNKDVYRLHDAMLDLQSKADHFTCVSERKYQQVWKMNKERADALSRTISFLEKTIYEKILGLNWTETKVQVLKQSELPSFKHAVDTFPSTDNNDDFQTIVKYEPEIYKTSQQNAAENESKQKLIKHILRMIADSSGFLIEGRLWPLLEKYEKAPVMLCKLDNIFNALEIKNEGDIKMLCNFFVKYAYCSICKDNEDQFQNGVESSSSNPSESIDTSPFEVESTTDSTSSEPDKNGLSIFREIDVELKMTQSEELLLEEAEEIIETVAKESTMEAVFSLDKITKPKTIYLTNSMPVLCQNGHQLSVDSAHALDALRDFVGSYKDSDVENRKIYSPKVPIAVSRFLKSEDVTLYWQKYKLIFPNQKEKLWDGLLCALNKYLPILQDRQKLNNEVVGLRKQNSELRHLLRGHMPSTDVPKQKYLTPISKSFRPQFSNN